jgi:hypothetical protein
LAVSSLRQFQRTACIRVGGPGAADGSADPALPAVAGAPDAVVKSWSPHARSGGPAVPAASDRSVAANASPVTVGRPSPR